MRTNIKDIAEELGVSTTTVSNALNGTGRVSEAIKEKIQSFAQQRNYQKNKIAARLVSKKSNTIGVFIFDSEVIIDTEIHVAYRAIRIYLERVRAKDYDILLFSIDRLDDNIDIFEICMAHAVEGVILMWPDKINGIKNLLESPLPTVTVERLYSGTLTTGISFDNKAGISMAVEFLRSLGHKKIGFVKGTDTTSSIVMERYNAFCSTMKKYNIFEKKYIFEAGFSLENGLQIGKKIAGLIDPPTAMINSADVLAIGMIRGLEEMGMNVPADMSVIGYDGFVIGQYMHKKLTSIRQDLPMLAKKTIDNLFLMIEKKIEIPAERIPVELVHGETTTRLIENS